MNPKRRKSIPKKLRAEVALRQGGICSCGCGEKLQHNFHLQHDPPLDLRLWDDVAHDTIPPANSKDHLFGMTVPCHLRQTNHPLGPHTTLNSDRHAIDKNRRLRGEVKGRPTKTWPKRSMRGPERRPARDINSD